MHNLNLPSTLHNQAVCFETIYTFLYVSNRFNTRQIQIYLGRGANFSPKMLQEHSYRQCRSTPTSAPPPKVSARAPAHRSYHFRGVKLKSCIKKIHHNLYISKQANVRIKHADTEGSSHKKFGTDARVQ